MGGGFHTATQHSAQQPGSWSSLRKTRCQMGGEKPRPMKHENGEAHEM